MFFNGFFGTEHQLYSVPGWLSFSQHTHTHTHTLTHILTHIHTYTLLPSLFLSLSLSYLFKLHISLFMGFLQPTWSFANVSSLNQMPMLFFASLTLSCTSNLLSFTLLHLSRLVVNFTNILRAAFSPIFFRQKSINPNFKYKKSFVYEWKSCT